MGVLLLSFNRRISETITNDKDIGCGHLDVLKKKLPISAIGSYITILGLVIMCLASLELVVETLKFGTRDVSETEPL